MQIQKKRTCCEIHFVKLRSAATELSLRPGDPIQAMLLACGKNCLPGALDYIMSNILINIR